MTTSHFREVCAEHGDVIRQCRCPGDKVEREIPCPGWPTCNGASRDHGLPANMPATGVVPFPMEKHP